ncbi:MoaD/ThiS family protein [Geoalkalibacter sp.]|uniref:MoaD/ThiS family protein n=1 Tax=Geoalkalibacter sp. TaxID=3041440 RepID=UPI00272DC7FF|nr:MoaD/ThiS family protein [Geoalkalibacter sp.]
MNVFVKCFAQLSRDEACNYHGSTPHELAEGAASVKHLIEKLGLRHEEIKLIFVNNLIVPPETILHEGDQVALAPATGGM